MQIKPGDPPSPSVPTVRVGMVEFTEWLDERVENLRVQWAQEIEATGLGHGRIDEGLLNRFVHCLVDMLPLMLGPHRDQILPLWIRGFELFGTVAARRGLAAGEAIEEVHLLRELVIRDLYRDPPMGGTVPLSLREVLRLNRALDRAVTHASVGHTDALFFEFFDAEGSGVLPEADMGPELSGQLDEIESEVHLVTAGASVRSLD